MVRIRFPPAESQQQTGLQPDVVCDARRAVDLNHDSGALSPSPLGRKITLSRESCLAR